MEVLVQLSVQNKSEEVDAAFQMADARSADLYCRIEASELSSTLDECKPWKREPLLMDIAATKYTEYLNLAGMLVLFFQHVSDVAKAHAAASQVGNDAAKFFA